MTYSEFVDEGYCVQGHFEIISLDTIKTIGTDIFGSGRSNNADVYLNSKNCVIDIDPEVDSYYNEDYTYVSNSFSGERKEGCVLAKVKEKIVCDYYDEETGSGTRKYTEEYTYCLISTKEGVKLYNGCDAEFDYPAEEENEYAELPDVLPDSFTSEQIKTAVSDGGLRVRTGPSKEYDCIDIIPYGNEVRVYGEKDGWCYVKYCGRYGWVLSTLLT